MNTSPDLATISNRLIVLGSLLVTASVVGIVGLLWCTLAGVFAGFLVGGLESLVLGVATGRVAAASPEGLLVREGRNGALIVEGDLTEDKAATLLRLVHVDRDPGKASA